MTPRAAANRPDHPRARRGHNRSESGRSRPGFAVATRAGAGHPLIEPQPEVQDPETMMSATAAGAIECTTVVGQAEVVAVEGALAVRRDDLGMVTVRPQNRQ